MNIYPRSHWEFTPPSPEANYLQLREKYALPGTRQSAKANKASYYSLLKIHLLTWLDHIFSSLIP